MFKNVCELSCGLILVYLRKFTMFVILTLLDFLSGVSRPTLEFLFNFVQEKASRMKYHDCSSIESETEVGVWNDWVWYLKGVMIIKMFISVRNKPKVCFRF